MERGEWIVWNQWNRIVQGNATFFFVRCIARSTASFLLSHMWWTDSAQVSSKAFTTEEAVPPVILCSGTQCDNGGYHTPYESEGNYVISLRSHPLFQPYENEGIIHVNKDSVRGESINNSHLMPTEC